MDSSWNKLGRAFWNGGIFGTAKALADQNRVPPQADAPLPNWKDLPLLTIDDHGFSDFNVKDPKWLEKIREVQPVTMARPYPTLGDLECDLCGMRLLTYDELAELREIDAFILRTYGKESSMEVRVRLALRPREGTGPTASFELTDAEVRLLRLVTPYMLGHEAGGGLPDRLLDFATDWGEDVKRRRSLCRFAAAIPLRSGTMRLGAEEYVGVKEMSVVVADFLRIAIDGPLSDVAHGVEYGTEVCSFVHFTLFTLRDMPELEAMTSLAKKLTNAASQLERQGMSVKEGKPIFVVSRKSFDFLLHDWYDKIAKARTVLVPRPPDSLPNLWDLGEAIIRVCGMTFEESKAWGDLAHVIRKQVGVDNLCEVLLEFDETI